MDLREKGNIENKFQPQIVYPEMEKYLRNEIRQDNSFFKELEAFARENLIPVVQPDVAKFMQILLKTTRPKRILEIGTAIGYSALLFANTLDSDVYIDTLELSADAIKMAEQNIDKAKELNLIKGDIINIIQGDCLETIKGLDEKYDFIFLDGPKGQYINLLDDCKRLLNSGGLLFTDNAFYKGTVSIDLATIHRRKRHMVKRLRQYITAICNDESLDTALIPIGDGVALSYMK